MAQPITLSSLNPREAVADALYRMLIGIDTNDRALFLSGMTQDAAVYGGNNLMLEGINQIDAFMFDRVALLDTTHMASNVRVDHKDGADEAYLTAYVLAQHFKTGDGPDEHAKSLLTGSQYFVDVVKDPADGLWKLKKLTWKLIWREGDRSIVMPTA